MKYCDIVEYNGSQLFSGAIDIDTYLDSSEKAKEIASCYVFHGKENHEGQLNGHILTDSISFIEKVVDALESEKPEMLLGIAGYGVGKSHLGLTIASLLSSSDKSLSDSILEKIKTIDDEAFDKLYESLNADNRRYLVIPINGMRNVNLKDLFFSTIKRVLAKDGVDSSCLDIFDPRFDALQNTIENYGNRETINKLFNESSVSELSFYKAMENMDSKVYDKIKKALPLYGIKFYEPAAIGELKDIISSVALKLCGGSKPYRAMLIVFDEFGKYMSFASSNEGAAGLGCLQLLFEGVNNQSGPEGHVVLLGLSQLDLKEYQRGSGEIAFTNAMKRYVTRFDAAKRYYLSACFETLVSNLIQVKDLSFIPSRFNVGDNNKFKIIHRTLSKYFKQVNNNSVWKDENTFVNLICKGCWPLSPYLVWTLSYITSVNNLLQQRSGFNILATLFNEFVYNLDSETENIPAVSLFQAGLLEEFLDSERSFSSADSIATEYSFLLQKYGHKLTVEEKNVLEGIVLTHKLKALCNNQSEMDKLLVELSGLSIRTVDSAIKSLTDEYNAINYNSAMGFYEIHADSVSFSQFDQVIQKYVKNFKLVTEPQEQFLKVSDVFAYSPEMTDIRHEYLNDIECDFASDNEISTLEWKYASNLIIGYDYLDILDKALNISDIRSRVDYNTPKGSVFYLVLPKTVQILTAKKEIQELFESKSNIYGAILPVMVLIISDEDDVILNSCIEIGIIDAFSKEEISKFSTLIPKHRERLFTAIKNAIEVQKYKKNYVYPEGINTKSPLKIAGIDIFEEIYPDVIPFFIDGSNWISSVQKFIELFSKGAFSWNDIQNTNDPKFINRARSLLIKQWQIVNVSGKVQTYPNQKTLHDLFMQYDELLEQGNDICLYDFYQKIQNIPYGANSTAASVIVLLYISCRFHEIDILKNEELVELSSFTLSKNCLSKNKGLAKNVWEDVIFRKAIRDDAKWISLIKVWSVETDLIKLIEHKKESEVLQENKISLPIHLSLTFADCLNRSNQAELLFLKWRNESSLIKNEIDGKVNQGRIGSTLRIYVEKYLPLFKDTIEKGKNLRPQMKFPAEIVEEAENFKKEFCSYIEFGIDSWINNHSLVYDCDKETFDKTCKSYEMIIRNLNIAELGLVANDLSNDLSECKEKRKALAEFSSIKKKASQELSSIQQNIAIGIYSSAQIVSNLDRLNDLSKTIDSFPKDKLNIIPEYSFATLRAEIQTSMSSLNKIGTQKDKDFESLFNSEIESSLDLDRIIEITSELIMFYKGFGDIKNDNLDDAKTMNKEANLLKEAYSEMKEAGLSIFSLRNIAESSKTKIKKELMDDSIFDDDEIIDLFESKLEESLYSRTNYWITKIKKVLDESHSVQDIDRLLYMIEDPPAYTSGISEQEILDIKKDALRIKRDLNMDYLKDLFNTLSKEEQNMFISWCKQKLE